jgi:hypothetical protein
VLGDNAEKIRYVLGNPSHIGSVDDALVLRYGSLQFFCERTDFSIVQFGVFFAVRETVPMTANFSDLELFPWTDWCSLSSYIASQCHVVPHVRGAAAMIRHSDCVLNISWGWETGDHLTLRVMSLEKARAFDRRTECRFTHLLGTDSWEEGERKVLSVAEETGHGAHSDHFSLPSRPVEASPESSEAKSGPWDEGNDAPKQQLAPCLADFLTTGSYAGMSCGSSYREVVDNFGEPTSSSERWPDVVGAIPVFLEYGPLRFIFDRDRRVTTLGIYFSNWKEMTPETCPNDLELDKSMTWHRFVEYSEGIRDVHFEVYGNHAISFLDNIVLTADWHPIRGDSIYLRAQPFDWIGRVGTNAFDIAGLMPGSV